jgi:NADH-quinone oxidoreductase subunit F
VADLHFTDDVATDAERAVIAAIVRPTGPAVVAEHERLVRGGATRRRDRRHLLLPALHALQREAGWISPGGLNEVGRQLGVPPAEAYGVATFYDLFRVEPPDHDGDTVHICVDPACRLAGSEELLARRRAAGEAVHASPCLGQCERPPAVFIQGRGRPDHVPADGEAFSLPQAGDPSLRLLRRIGVVDPTSLDSYRAAGGYEALERARRLGPEAVIAEVETSGLLGRGGAAFPTGVKWRAVAGESGEKHVVVNADESEPGTFKDRTLLEHDPFAVVEAATIAGFATGATSGWVYVRGEYPLAAARIEAAAAAARSAGLLGDGFDLEVRRGAGAYICGEETALFNSLEGFRGEPRQKPPFPTTHGLFGRPTVVNNPETLVNVLDIVTGGGAAYAATGTEGSRGTRLFCLSGHVARPGLYEVVLGATLREVLDLAGGATGTLRAVLLGGAAGNFVGPDRLDLPLTFEATRDVGLTLGSGVVMAFDDTVDFTDVVGRITAFFRDESCGQCVPCRLGTIRQHELVVRGELDAAMLDDIDRVMRDASICGLGHTAGSAVRSALALGLVGTPT